MGAVAYVCFAALKDAQQLAAPLLALTVLPVLLFQLWRRTDALAPGDYRGNPAAAAAIRACGVGIALWLSARSGAVGKPGLDAAANLGAGMCAVAALSALARIPVSGGLMAQPPSTRSLDASGFAALLWGIAVAVPGTRAVSPSRTILLDPLAVDYATTTAGIGTLLVFVAATSRLRLQRRLEIGVADRAAGALALSATALLVAVPAAAANIAAPDRVLPIGVLAASAACVWTVTTREPTTVSTALRGVLAVMILGVPLILMIGVSVREVPRLGSAVALAGCVASIGVGLVARAVARPLGPEQSRWLSALSAACRAVLLPEPDAALRAALVALKGTATTPEAQPAIYRAEPPEALTVDVAGNVRVEPAEAPARLYDIALAEPERTLRAEVLSALTIRRPDIRPLAQWFEMRGAFSATVITDDDGPMGFILLSRGKRTKPMTLEEARAVRILADRLSALLSVSAALARAHERQVDASRRADRLEAECTRLEGVIHRESGRHRSRAAALARPLRATAYSAAARFALAELERAARSRPHIALVAPPGVNAIAWAATAHLASARAGGPFVIADATSNSERSPERFGDDPDSPLALADSGTLVLLEPAALPRESQEALAEALVRHASEPDASAVPRVGVIAVSRFPLAALAESDRLVKPLLSLLGGIEVKLPSLSERPEDLRALSLDQLASLGLRLRGEPAGIEPAALAVLLDHEFANNDAQLSEVLSRAVEASEGPVISVADLRKAGLSPMVEGPPVTLPPPPQSARRRPRATGSRRPPR